jgi:hypothetical protein
MKPILLARVVAPIVVALSVASYAAHAEPKKDLHRIGYLGQTHSSLPTTSIKALREGLRDLGYREGTAGPGGSRHPVAYLRA